MDRPRPLTGLLLARDLVDAVSVLSEFPPDDYYVFPDGHIDYVTQFDWLCAEESPTPLHANVLARLRLQMVMNPEYAAFLGAVTSAVALPGPTDLLKPLDAFRHDDSEPRSIAMKGKRGWTSVEWAPMEQTPVVSQQPAPPRAYAVAAPAPRHIRERYWNRPDYFDRSFRRVANLKAKIDAAIDAELEAEGKEVTRESKRRKIQAAREKNAPMSMWTKVKKGFVKKLMAVLVKTGYYGTFGVLGTIALLALIFVGRQVATGMLAAILGPFAPLSGTIVSIVELYLRGKMSFQTGVLSEVSGGMLHHIEIRTPSMIAADDFRAFTRSDEFKAAVGEDFVLPGAADTAVAALRRTCVYGPGDVCVSVMDRLKEFFQTPYSADSCANITDILVDTKRWPDELSRSAAHASLKNLFCGDGGKSRAAIARQLGVMAPALKNVVLPLLKDIGLDFVFTFALTTGLDTAVYAIDQASSSAYRAAAFAYTNPGYFVHTVRAKLAYSRQPEDTIIHHARFQDPGPAHFLRDRRSDGIPEIFYPALTHMLRLARQQLSIADVTDEEKAAIDAAIEEVARNLSVAAKALARSNLFKPDAEDRDAMIRKLLQFITVDGIHAVEFPLSEALFALRKLLRNASVMAPVFIITRVLPTVYYALHEQEKEMRKREDIVGVMQGPAAAPITFRVPQDFDVADLSGSIRLQGRPSDMVAGAAKFMKKAWESQMNWMIFAGMVTPAILIATAFVVPESMAPHLSPWTNTLDMNLIRDNMTIGELFSYTPQPGVMNWAREQVGLASAMQLNVTEFAAFVDDRSIEALIHDNQTLTERLISDPNMPINELFSSQYGAALVDIVRSRRPDLFSRTDQWNVIPALVHTVSDLVVVLVGILRSDQRASHRAGRVIWVAAMLHALLPPGTASALYSYVAELALG